jgi:hypothetical protein
MQNKFFMNNMNMKKINLKEDGKTISQLIKQVVDRHNVSADIIKSSIKISYEDYLKDSKMRFFFKNFHPKKGDVVLDVLILADVLPGFDYGPDKYDFDDCKSFMNAHLKKGY